MRKCKISVIVLKYLIVISHGFSYYHKKSWNYAFKSLTIFK